MEFKATCVILGMKRFKGDVEGKNYDSTTIYVEERFASENENGRGCAAVEYKAGKSEVFERFEKSAFPMQAVLSMEIVTTGRSSSTFVRSIEPVKTAQVVK